MPAYYNEIDPFAAQWLKNLIAQDLIAPGDVDERSIREVDSSDLEGFSQCHFFAGIGVWSHALRCAGVSDDEPVWTGSPPCQPFSGAGSRKGTNDDRHLWPDFFRLIAKRRPPLVFGEQVASKDGLAWFDLVQADLEGAGYAAAAVDLCAAGFGAPHIRQRLFFVGMADANSSERERRTEASEWNNGLWPDTLRAKGDGSPSACGVHGGMGDTDSARSQGRRGQRELAEDRGQDSDCGSGAHGSSFWAGADWVECDDPLGRDPRWRPVESGSFPLADGAPNRVGRLRAYGNAIVAPVATEFIKAALACRP